MKFLVSVLCSAVIIFSTASPFSAFASSNATASTTQITNDDTRNKKFTATDGITLAVGVVIFIITSTSTAYFTYKKRITDKNDKSSGDKL